MLTIDNIAKRFGSQTLFQNASFAIRDKSRIGMIGPNGAGKTTFFRMIMGSDLPDEGEIRVPKRYRIVCMDQEWIPSPKDSILEATVKQYTDWHNLKTALAKTEEMLAKNSSEGALKRYHDLESEFFALGGHHVEQEAKEILAGLGFKESEFTGEATKFSGGWRMRCHLAGLLLQKADLLLLDEPTNHLDVESVVWFEEFLKNYDQAFMLISHDRLLIERLADEILEFAPPTLTLWPHSLKEFETQKAARIEILEAELANKQREIDRMQDFVRRFRAKATKARQAQNRLKTAEHYQKEMEAMRANMPVISKRPSRFRLKLATRLPRTVLEISDAEFGYSKKQPLFHLDGCIIESGRKIGIVGANGVGKSTFLKSCAGELDVLSGTLKRQERVLTALFAQHRMEELPLESVALDYLIESAHDNSLTDIRGVAASLGLTANDLDKPVGVLSGGEKARVSLSRILLSRPGLLLLDEPTNHLDLEACDALVKGLSDYEGTVLLVSHNRSFLDALVDFILEVKPGESILHHGNYSDWLSQREPAQNKEKASKVAGGNHNISKTVAGKKTKEQKRKEAQERQARSKALAGFKAELSSCEKELEGKREELQSLDQLLMDPQSPQNPDFTTWLKQRHQLEKEIQRLETQWLELSERFEEVSS